MALRARLGWHQTQLACLKVEAERARRSAAGLGRETPAAQAAHENGRAAMQMHGAIGFQSECDVHWFMKRAHVYDQAGRRDAAQARKVIAEPSPLW